MTVARMVAACCASIALWFPNDLAGQELEAVALGNRVRLTSPAILAWTAEGSVTGNGDGWVSLSTGEGSVRIPVNSVTRVEVSAGMRRRTARGGVLGFLTGLAASALIVGADEADGEIDPACGENHCYGYGFRVGLMGAGLVTGALVGWVWRTEQWEDLPSASPSLDLEKSPDGRARVRLGLRLTW